MINDLFTAAEDIILSCTNPSVYARLAMGSDDAARAEKFLRDYYFQDEDTDVVDYMPFWVLRLKHSQYSWNSWPSGMKAATTIECVYFETARQYDRPNRQIEHRLSSVYFGAFFYDVFEHVSGQSGIGDTFSLSSITISLPPQRTLQTMSDPDEPNTDYWQAAFDLNIGDGAT